MSDFHQLEFGYLLNQLVSNFHKPQDSVLASAQNLIIPGIVFALLVSLLIVIRKALTIKGLLKEPSMLLELTPPSLY